MLVFSDERRNPTLFKRGKPDIGFTCVSGVIDHEAVRRDPEFPSGTSEPGFRHNQPLVRDEE
jgi:hypothetical protein